MIKLIFSEPFRLWVHRGIAVIYLISDLGDLSVQGHSWLFQVIHFIGIVSVCFAISLVFVLTFESPFMHLQKLVVGGMKSKQALLCQTINCLILYLININVFQSWCVAAAKNRKQRSLNQIRKWMVKHTRQLFIVILMGPMASKLLHDMMYISNHIGYNTPILPYSPHFLYHMSVE